MTHPLDFEAARDRRPDSWERGDPCDAVVIQRVGWDEWVVMLPGGSPHVVQLHHDGQHFVGSCDCEWFEHRQLVGAHLAAIRKAAVIGLTDDLGNPIRIPDAAERHDQHVEEAVAATDGGGRR